MALTTSNHAPAEQRSPFFVGSFAELWQNARMSAITVHLPERLEANLADRVRESGASSAEEYLIRLVESDMAIEGVEAVLVTRLSGPFGELEHDWKARVRANAANRAQL